MKKLFTFALLTVASMPLFAQFTMNRSNFPNIGDSQYYTVADTTLVTPGPAGTGQTWNFSTLTDNGSSLTINYVAPSSMAQGSSFPTANLGENPTNNQYRFYTAGNDSIELNGEKSGLNTVVVYSQLPRLYAFPMNFGYTYQDSAIGQYPDGFISNVTRRGWYLVEFDGSGDLTTPYGTFNNVNRIKTTAYFNDSSWTGVADAEVATLRYEWYEATRTQPLLIITYTNVIINGGNPQANKEVWYADNSIAVEDGFASFGLGVAPNPAHGNAQVRFHMTEPGSVRIDVLNALGAKVLAVAEGERGAGVHQVEVGLEGLSAGMYFVALEVNGKREVRKLVVE